MTDLQRSHAELRAAVILAGKEIRKLKFGGADSPVLAVRRRVLRESRAVRKEGITMRVRVDFKTPEQSRRLAEWLPILSDIVPMRRGPRRQNRPPSDCPTTLPGAAGGISINETLRGHEPPRTLANVSAGLEEQHFRRFCSQPRRGDSASAHTTTPASRRRLRRPWRENNRFANRSKRLSTSSLSSRAFGLGMSNDGAASDPKPCVTLLAALPAIGHTFGPADAVGTAVRKHLDPNVSAVYENVRSRAYFQRV